MASILSFGALVLLYLMVITWLQPCSQNQSADSCSCPRAMLLYGSLDPQSLGTVLG